MNAADPAAFLEVQVRRLAGHLLMLDPDDAFLETTARDLLGEVVDDPQRLASSLTALGTELGTHLTSAEQAGLPLVSLARAFDLTPLDLDLLLFAVLPEYDDRFGDAFQRLRGGGSVRRPTLGIALRALLPPALRWPLRGRIWDSPLWRCGLLLEDDPELPLPDRALRPLPVVVAALEGHRLPTLPGGAPVHLVPGTHDDPALSSNLGALAGELVAWLEEAGTGLVHLVHPPGTGQVLQLAGAIAVGLNRPLLRVGPVAQEPETALAEAVVMAVLDGAVPCLELTPEVRRLGVTLPLPPLPVLVAAPAGCTVDAPASLPLRRVPPPFPRPLEQARTWEALLDHVGGSARTDLLANQTRLTVPEMERIVDLAARRARVEGRRGPEHRDVAAALAELVRGPAPALARTRRPRVSWKRLVLPPRSKAQLEDLVRRVQHRVTVQDRWGMNEGEGRGNGLVALFHGEPGTGKTLAAEAIATQLDLPLVSVDLSQVVSKYVGETEKNLAAVFDETEGHRGLLFFDEADALFGRRTGVRDAHDRYANLETNFLLQRLEVFEGVAILATNQRQNMDDAFTRRLQFIVQFPRPGPAQQHRIWQQHLSTAPLGEDLDLEALARFDLVGGEIRNASLTAAYAAAARQGSIAQALLVEACRQELAKRGRRLPGGQGS